MLKLKKRNFSPFFYTLMCLALLMGFYSLERAIFFIWNYQNIMPEMPSRLFWAFLHGLRFDLCALLFINTPVLFLSYFIWTPLKRAHLIFLSITILILNIPFIIINQIDIEFVNFLGRRLTLGNLSILTEAKGKFSAFLMTYSPIIIIQLSLLALFIYLTIKLRNQFLRSPIVLSPFLYMAIILITIPLQILGMRGGLQRKPLDVVHAIEFDSSHLNQMILNSSFTILKSKHEDLLEEKSYFPNRNSLKPFLNGTNKYPSAFKENLSKKKMNIVIFILESFSQEYMDFAPFLKELASQGLYFTNNYANGRRSIEAISSITAGIPALMTDSYVRSPYFNNQLKGIGHYFKNLGYHSSFFHGGLPGTMFFDSFTKKAGFDHYYSADDHPNPEDSDNFWGIFDEPFLKFALSQIDGFPKPFLTGIFTLTSHHPFKVPDSYKDKLPKGEIPILQTIAYTDYSLRQFFNKTQTKEWYQNTLFVLTGDHTSLSYKKEFNNPLGKYRVPLILFSPTIKWPKVDQNELTQQADILPTLLDMFKIEDPMPALFGKSIFKGSSKIPLLADQTYYLIQKNEVLELSAQGQSRVFDYIKDADLKFPIDSSNKIELENSLRANIQYFNNGLIKNTLYE